ncbi:hypothetical protein GIB67_026722 [Kingdonia uniflora]|uniref:Uncharacterized protein n=1 Tax=Kingdonia uniflora TaxID=39325 RepID=A0A7J7MHA1_9MAGN|nr:hypothetical protein GIB67_026722 [Kingdonia uniflora]
MEYRKIKDQDKDPDVVEDDIEGTHGKPISSVSLINVDRSKWKVKSIVTTALTILTSSQAILIVWSKRAGKYDYSVTTANFSVEALKCALSLAALARSWSEEGVNDNNKLSTTWDEVMVYPIPAALYLVKNLLQYYIFAYVDAPGYQILKNLNIISTGVLYRIILKKKLSKIQWAAFILLCAGCTTAQLDTRSDHVLQTPFQGWMMAIVMALLSGFAGVYTEAIIKKRPSRNINVQNFWLYVFGMAFNAIAIFIQDFDAVANNSLTGNIPQNMGNCTDFQVLDLFYNLLAGEIPFNIGFLQVATLSLEESRLTVKVPAVIGLMQALAVLNLICNLLSGAIPAILCGCFQSELRKQTDLFDLNAANNNLEGPIPHNPSSYTNLCAATS